MAFGPLCSTGLRCQTTDEPIERSFRAGQMAMQQGQFARAAEDFKKVLALDPGLLEAEVNLGLAYQGLLEYDLATRYLVKALRERPTLLGPTVIVGMNYVKLGLPEKGVPYLQTALKLDASNRDAREALASSYLARGDFQDAAEQFREIAHFTPDQAEACFRLGHEYLDLAARLAYRGAQLYPDSSWGHRFLGDLLFERERWQDAIDEYQKAFATDPREPGLHAAIGEAYLHAGKVQQADAAFRAELQLDPGSDAARRGQAALNGNKNEAGAALQAHEPPAAPAVKGEGEGKRSGDSERLELGKARFASQQYEAAAEALSKVHGAANAEASYWLERTYQALGAQTYAQLESSFPGSWRSHQLRAESYALRGSLQEALDEFNAALALRPDEPELHESLGELYLDHNNLEAAQRELEQAVAADPARTHALYLLGRVFVEQKNNEKALPYLERALRIQPDLAEANSLLGTAYLRLGQFADAVSRLEKAAPSDHFGNVHYQLFVAYKKLGQPERAQRELLLSKNLRKSYLERDQAMIMGARQPEADQ